MTSARALTFFVALVAIGGLPSLAQADDVEDDATRRGVDLRKAGDDRAALKVFQDAYAKSPTPRLEAQVALARQALGEWVQAEQELREALLAEGDPWIAKNKGALGAALATVEAHLGWVEIDTDASSGELWIDGKRAGSIADQRVFRAPTGTVTVELRGVRIADPLRHVDITAGRRERLHFGRLSDAQEATPARPIDRGVRATEPHDGTTAEWVLVGAGGALALGAAGAHFVWQRAASIYNDDSRCLYGSMTRDQRCGDYARTASTYETLAIVGYVVGGASIATGLALMLLPPPAKPRPSALRCAPTLGGVACAGAF